jgi:osmotically-inducible protein OsmY
MADALIPEVAKRVSTALDEDERTRDLPIEVIDEDGLVTLRGTVGSDEACEVAVEIAEEQEGVIEVVDELEVEEDDTVTPPARIPPRNW